MNIVVTNRRAKDAFLQIRIREDVKEELAVLAELRGLSMSALINSLIVRAIREEKMESPEAFRAKRSKGILSTEIQLTGGKKRKTG